jgi:hypothetical protein
VVKQQAYFLPVNQNQVDRKLLAWKNCSKRWLINNISDEQIMQICALIYKYTFDAEKKKSVDTAKSNGRSNTITDLYLQLARECGWSYGEFSTCPYNKAKLVARRAGESKQKQGNIKNVGIK